MSDIIGNRRLRAYIGKPLMEYQRRELATIAGGYTITPMQGGWVDDEGDLHEDDGVVVEVFTAMSEVGDVIAYLSYAAYVEGETHIAWSLENVTGHVAETRKRPPLEFIA